MNRRTNLLLALLAALLLAACGTTQGGSDTDGMTAAETTGQTSETSEYPLTVEDSLGRTVEIEEEPGRLGSVAPSLTESIFAVGAGDRVVGVSTAGDYPGEVEDIEKIGDFTQVNAERAASLDIDVLFLSFSSTTEEQAENLEDQTGADVIVSNPETLDEAIESIGLVGEAVGEVELAEDVQEEMRAELDEIEAAVEGETEPTVFYEVGFDPLFTAGPGSFIDDAIDVAGGENAAGDANEPYPQYPIEQLVQNDPEIYLAGSLSGSTVEDIQNREAYSSLRAVQEDRVYLINDDLVNRPGPRIVEGVREIAETIHPDAFE